MADRNMETATQRGQIENWGIRSVHVTLAAYDDAAHEPKRESAYSSADPTAADHTADVAIIFSASRI